MRPEEKYLERRNKDALSMGTLKRAAFLFSAICWLMFSIGFGGMLAEFLLQGSGIRLLGIHVSSASALIGVVHFAGLSFAMLFSLALAIWLGARGLVRNEPQPEIHAGRQ